MTVAEDHREQAHSLQNYAEENYPSVKKYLQSQDARKQYLLRDTIKGLEKYSELKTPEILNNAGELTDLILSSTETDRYTLSAAFLYAAFHRLPDIPDAKNFDPLVYQIAKSVFKFPDIGKMNFTKESDNFIKLLLSVMGDVRAVIIRLFEQLRRSKEAEGADISLKKKIAAQNLAVFAPAAHRLGLYKLKEALENIGLQFSKPEVYKSISNRLTGTKADREKYILKFLEPVKKSLNEQKLKYTVKWRTKSVFSVWNKMVKKNVDFEEVYDVFALRIILGSKPENEIKDCWQVYSLVTQHYKPDTSRLRDWISFPKASGYESLQTTVYGPGGRPVEVQIRTERMDDIAENGPAAHWKYKGSKKGDSNLWLENMRKAIENPEDRDTDPEFAGTDNPEIYVITPKGDIIAVKKSYTIIDLAFMIHTEIGERCTGAMVNGKIRPISYRPQNGDTIKILTDKNTSPGRDWLKIAQSSAARARIRRLLNLNIYTQAQAGKELLAIKFKQLKLEFSDMHLKKLKKHGKFSSNLEMFHAYATGKADPKNIKPVLQDKQVETEAEQAKTQAEVDNSEQLDFIPAPDYLVIDRSLTSVKYSQAKCCKPLPGDKIFGFNTANKGLKIHKLSCPNAKDMFSRYPYRIMKARWSDEAMRAKFEVELKIGGEDNEGVATKITEVINNTEQIKLNGIELAAKENGKFEGAVRLEVKNREELKQLKTKIRRIKEITKVR